MLFTDSCGDTRPSKVLQYSLILSFASSSSIIAFIKTTMALQNRSLLLGFSEGGTSLAAASATAAAIEILRAR